jgi:hypothetical protein
MTGNALARGAWRPGRFWQRALCDVYQSRAAYHQEGSPGEEFELQLELKLLADVGW